MAHFGPEKNGEPEDFSFDLDWDNGRIRATVYGEGTFEEFFLSPPQIANLRAMFAD